MSQIVPLSYKLISVKSTYHPQALSNFNEELESYVKLGWYPFTQFAATHTDNEYCFSVIMSKTNYDPYVASVTKSTLLNESWTTIADSVQESL